MYLRDSIYEQIGEDGMVRKRAFYDERGNQFNRQDFDHAHYVEGTRKKEQPHEYSYGYNNKNQRIYSIADVLKPGYDNRPTR